MERTSKLVLTWHLGRRTMPHTEQFIVKLRAATSEKTYQITTDAFRPYMKAIAYGLGDRVEYAQLVKVYAQSHEGAQRYSPADVVNAVPVPVSPNADPARICTSHVERQNLTMRMQIRRWTRLTNGFSKTWKNHKAAIALHFAFYNFCRVHRTLKTTPAIKAGITNRVWGIAELLA